MQTADIVHPGIRDRDRRLVFGFRHHHQPGIGLQVGVHAGPVLARPVVAVAGHAQEDQPRIERQQTLIVRGRAASMTPALKFSTTTSATLGKLAREFAAGVRLEVDRDRFLAAMDHHISVGAIELRVGRGAPGRVAAACCSRRAAPRRRGRPAAACTSAPPERGKNPARGCRRADAWTSLPSSALRTSWCRTVPAGLARSRPP